jgi:carbonic anhydrase
MENKNHKCKYLALICLDWRLHPQSELYFKTKFKNFDLCSLAGSVKNLNNKKLSYFLMNQIKISLNLHKIEGIILTIHKDCGAYGGSKVFKDEEEEYLHHLKELKKASLIIKRKFPKLKIKKIFINLKEQKGNWQCFFKEIK